MRPCELTEGARRRGGGDEGGGGGQAVSQGDERLRGHAAGHQGGLRASRALAHL